MVLMRLDGFLTPTECLDLIEMAEEHKFGRARLANRGRLNDELFIRNATRSTPAPRRVWYSRWESSEQRSF